MRSVHGLDLFLVFLAHLYAGNGACELEKAALLTCETLLSTDLNQRLESQFGLTNVGVEDLQNSTLEYGIRSMRDVICDPVNKVSVECIVDNLASCNQLLQDEDFRSGLVGYIISGYWDEIQAAPSTCEALKTRACALLKPRLNSCGINLFGEIIDGRQLSRKDVCLADHSYIDCVIEITKECYSLVQEGNAVYVRHLILQDHWNLFSDATRLCDCYSGVECWSNAKSALNQFDSSSSQTVTEVYDTALEFSQTICGNKANLKCAQDRVPTCQSIQSLKNNGELSMFYRMSDEMCSVVGSDAFSSNKECILKRLVEQFHPCISRAELPKTGGITTCSQLNSIYTCVYSAFNGQCNQNLQEPMFTMFRGDNFRLNNCNLTAAVDSASTFQNNIILSMFTVFSVIIFF